MKGYQESGDERSINEIYNDVERDVASRIYGLPDGVKLGVSLAMDAIGLIPWGPIDLLYGPIQGAWLKMAYRSNIAAGVGAIEEMLPGTDIMPTCTITHFASRRNRQMNSYEE